MLHPVCTVTVRIIVASMGSSIFFAVFSPIMVCVARTAINEEHIEEFLEFESLNQIGIPYQSSISPMNVVELVNIIQFFPHPLSRSSRLDRLQHAFVQSFAFHIEGEQYCGLRQHTSTCQPLAIVSSPAFLGRSGCFSPGLQSSLVVKAATRPNTTISKSELAADLLHELMHKQSHQQPRVL